MEIFRYKHLALGCALFLVFLPISFHLSAPWRITILICSCALATGSALLYAFMQSKKTLCLMLRAVPALLFVALAMVVALIAFNSDELLEQVDGQEHLARVKITDVSYYSKSFGIYEADLLEIDGQEVSHKIELRCQGQELLRGDIALIKGELKKISSPTVGFDSSSYSLGKGVVAGMLASSFQVIENEPMPFFDFLDSANEFLDERFQRIGESETYALLSALFLGNKDNLGLDVRRDFTRIGLNHILALSGMHITIVVTLIGYSLAVAPLRKAIKELILIASTVIFVGMTGFSLSAVRAGFMVCLVYTLQFFGGRISIISALFLSVTIICISSPYSVFSLSLILSFFAMLGCMVASKIIRRYKLYKVFKYKATCFVVLSFISTTFALLFTLPIASMYFGSFSTLSIISNIVIAPFFSVLIYLCPVYLLLADIPILSTAIGSICIGISKLATFLGSTLAGVDGALIPIMSYAQYMSAAFIAIFLFLLLMVKRRLLLRVLFGVGVGTLSFAIGSLALFVQRWNNVYIGAYSETGDVAFIEDCGELTIVDMTDASASKHILSGNVSEYLGYFEIDNYVLTTYSAKSVTSFNNLTDTTIVRKVFLFPPIDEREEEIFNQLCSVAASKGIEVSINEGSIATKSTTVTFAPTNRLPRSAVKCNSFCVDFANTRFTYLGKSSFELCSPFVEDAAYLSDIVIFGDYGPDFKMNYKYQMPYVDYAVFLGDTIDYADKNFLAGLGKKATRYSGVPLRFCLTP